MAQIQFNADGTINFGDYTLTFTNEGFEFDGAILATEHVEAYSFGGTVSGYTSGGWSTSPPIQTTVNTIDKFSFSTDANATDVGDLTSVARYGLAGQSSTTHGYATAGRDLTSGASPTYGLPFNIIEKFPFSVDSNATDVGDLTQARFIAAGNNSQTNGYTSGGQTPSVLNTIDKFPFAVDANATDVGDLIAVNSFIASQSSETNGYVSGDYLLSNVIQKFPFSTDANATDVGDLTQGRYDSAGQSSVNSGYTSGGASPPSLNTIDKFPFASDANATDVGDLTQPRRGGAGQSSTSNGYTSGGDFQNTIDKFSFSTDASATDVGDLTLNRRNPAGQQV